MMDRLVSLSVGVEEPDDFARLFQDLSELARNLGVNHNYVSVSSSHTDLQDGPADEDLYYDENTLRKVYSTLRQGGLGEQPATEIINALQNAGIVFRERMPS